MNAMACKKKKRLKQFLELCFEDKLFESPLKSSVFECVLEIIGNAKRARFSECFSARTKKKMLKYKTLLKTLTSKKISLKKRKKRFLKCDASEKKLFNSYIIADFVKNCLHHE